MRKFMSFFAILVFFSFLPVTHAKSGCCSWHGGVDYCDTSTGRQVCNDGTYSPSCTCQYIPPPPVCYSPGNISDLTVEAALNSDSCDSYKVKAMWSEAQSATGYSVSLTDSQSTPDSSSETGDRIFWIDTKNGDYFVNVKAVNKCGSSNVISKAVSLPIKDSSFELITTDTEDSLQISFAQTCITKITMNTDNTTSELKINEPLSIEKVPGKEYVFMALGQNGKAIEKKIVIPTQVPVQEEVKGVKAAENEITSTIAMKPDTNEDTDTSSVSTCCGAYFVISVFGIAIAVANANYRKKRASQIS